MVIPLFNVESTLAACLDSVLAQPVRDLEVVVVDDGSTDGSTAIAREYADRRPEVTLHVQTNHGVSYARNLGVERCTGDLVTFVDPDDLVPRDGFGPMLRALARTGSDVAVGSMVRVDAAGRRTQPPLLKRNHAQERLAVTIDDVPLLVADAFACNKVFRVDFWRREGLGFPLGVRYEDQVLCTAAFLAASSIDVLTDVVYEWHIRDDLSSATQVRGHLQNLEDRIVTKHMTIDLVRAHGNPALWDVLHREVLPIDMWEHFRAAVSPSTAEPDRYWTTLRTGLLGIWNDDTLPFEQTAVPPGQRLMGWLVAQDRRADLARLVARIDGPGVPVEDGRYLHPWLEEPGVPEVLSRVAPPPA